MLKNLFGSQIRVDLLNLFFMHPGEEFYMRQIIKDLTANPRAVSRELNNLQDMEFVNKRISGKQHYFSINQKHLIYNEMRDIFVKTVGLADVLKTKLKPFEKNIQFAFVYGSMAKGTYKAESDIDIVIIGDMKSRQIAAVLSDMGEKSGREVNYVVYPLSEVESRLKKKNHFVTTLLKEPLLFFIGSENEFKRLAEQWLAEETSDQ